MKLLLLALVSLVVISSSSCYKMYCNEPSLILRWSGFDTSDFEFVVVDKYQKNGSFSHLVNQRLYIKTDDQYKLATIHGWGLVDTIYYSGPSNGISMDLDADYDYTFALPAIGQTYRITGISFGNEYTRAGNSDGCTKSATWYIDRQMKTYAGYYYSSGTADVEIKK